MGTAAPLILVHQQGRKYAVVGPPDRPIGKDIRRSAVPPMDFSFR